MESTRKNIPATKIEFSEYAKLRLCHCILAGRRGTHATCTCTVHQNVQLMIQGAKLNSTMDDDIVFKDYKSFMAKIMSNQPSIVCHLNKWSSYPGTELLKDKL